MVTNAFGSTNPTSNKEGISLSDKEFNAFLKGWYKKAHRIASFRVGNKDDADDIVQQVWISLYENYRAKPLSELNVLATTMLANKILDFFRRQKTQINYVSRISHLASDGEDDEGALGRLGILSDDNNPEALFGIKKDITYIVTALDAAIEKLTDQQKKALMLHHIHELTYEETAEKLGCRTGTVKTHVQRASEKVRKYLVHSGITPDQCNMEVLSTVFKSSPIARWN